MMTKHIMNYDDNNNMKSDPINADCGWLYTSNIENKHISYLMLRIIFVELCKLQSTIPKSKRIDTNVWPQNVVIIAVFLLILSVFYLCMWLESRYKIPYLEGL